MTSHETFMRTALKLAHDAAGNGEIPVGAVIVRGGVIIGSGMNRNRELQNPTRHAEMMAIEEACGVTGNERLNGCSIYVTKEPCAMCAGAIVHARIDEVYIAAEDQRFGACGTALQVCGNPQLNHVPRIHFDVLREEASSMLSSFFQNIREKRK